MNMTDQDGKGGGQAQGTIVFDLDGVLYLGDAPIAGAAEAITILTAQGWQLLFATNNSSKTPRAVADVLYDRAGIVVDGDAVVTSGMAVASYLVDHGLRSAFVIGSPELRATLEEVSVSIIPHDQAPDAVVVGLDRSLTYAKIGHAARSIRRGAAFIATNLDPTIPTATGEDPGAGTIVAAVAKASDRAPVTCGKPHQPMLDLVSAKISSLSVGNSVWMVGDRPETDIAFAKHAGWRSVLTLSGITKATSAIPEHLIPDHVVRSIAELPDILKNDAEKRSAHEG